MDELSAWAAFPPALRELVEAELAAGNSIVEVSSTFPAPPAGAYVKLARPVTTRERASAPGVSFYDRNSSSYSGEFADERRFYFVLEPPRPPEPEPDMNAIRAEIEARQRAADAARFATEEPVRREPPVRSSAAVEQFRESMVCTYERWHDGIGYDLAILKTATPAERAEIEDLLLSRAIDDWRDVEALAALDTPRAQAALRRALARGSHPVRIAVVNYAPHLVSQAERTASLVRALAGADTYGGLTQALLQVQEYHPPEVIEALLRGVLARDDGAPVHFAAMLMYLHGQASSAFDWEQRPFFLKFHTQDQQERKQLFAELCAKIGVEPAAYLQKY